MDLSVHDIIQIHSVEDVIYDKPKPSWVTTSLKKAPFVVVRRAPVENGFVPVGIRGATRSERFPAFVHTEKIKKVVTPEQIIREKKWHLFDHQIFKYLEKIDEIMKAKSVIWGVVGSVGFELVSKVATVHDKSDIDILVRDTPRLTKEVSKQLIEALKNIPVKTDVQVETKDGSFSLYEYANANGKPILFKTKDGPILKEITDLRPDETFI